MSEPVENYIPRSIQAAMRRQAWRAWAVGLGVVFVWAFLIILAPLAKAYGFESIAASLNGFYHYICHRIPERSFHIAGEQFGVCSRCSGVYFGLFAGFAIYLPELFPTRLRSTGTSFCYNVGRFIAASGPITLGVLVSNLAKSAKAALPAIPDEAARKVAEAAAELAAFRNAGTWMSLIFILGLIALLFLPETKGRPMPED